MLRELCFQRSDFWTFWKTRAAGPVRKTSSEVSKPAIEVTLQALVDLSNNLIQVRNSCSPVPENRGTSIGSFIDIPGIFGVACWDGAGFPESVLLPLLPNWTTSAATALLNEAIWSRTLGSVELGICSAKDRAVGLKIVSHCLGCLNRPPPQNTTGFWDCSVPTRTEI